MADESAYVLEVIYNELQKQDAEVVGRLELTPDAVTAFAGQMIITADVRSEADYHPSIAHCHFIVRIGNTSWSDPLDACVLGIDPDRRTGLGKAAQNWITNVGSAIFSLLHARPVMNAAHFDGNDSWGVPGCHRFVGPFFGYGEQIDAARLSEAGLFEDVAALAPPGMLHLAKVVLEARGKDGWRRTIEIDGHQAQFEEKSWQVDLPAPVDTVVSQFALFHHGGKTDVVEERQRLDDAIRRFVSVVSNTKRVENASAVLVDEGIEADLADRVATFLPLAFMRVIFADFGPKFSPDYVRVRADGSAHQLRLLQEPAFARGTALYSELLSSGHLEAVKSISTYSSTFNVVNQALAAGSKPQDLVLFPPVVPDRGVDPATLENAVKQVQDSQTKKYAPPKPRRPWWRFW